MDYIVIKSSSIEELNTIVNRYIEDDYRAYGKLVMITDSSGVVFAQPMISMKLKAEIKASEEVNAVPLQSSEDIMQMLDASKKEEAENLNLTN